MTLPQRTRPKAPPDFVPGWYVRREDSRVLVDGPLLRTMAILSSAMLPGTRTVYLTSQAARGYTWNPPASEGT